jgi:hypothetical protein
MEQVVRVARLLREEHGFLGYIHLKTIPDADPALVEEAGRLADRLSINVELPTASGLAALAPEKNLPGIRRAMGGLRTRIEDARGRGAPPAAPPAPRFAPAGQSTQMMSAPMPRTMRRSWARRRPSMRVPAEAGLLLRLFAGAGCLPRAAADRAALIASTAVPGRLAAALLRLHAGRRWWPGARRGSWTSSSIPRTPGR